jgi:geranylgeranyl pyrophosphate synthase
MEYLKDHSGQFSVNSSFEQLDQNLHKRKNFLLNLVIEKNKKTSNPDTRQYLQEGLDAVSQMMLSQVEDYHPDLKAAAELLLSKSGKRIRPRVILLIGGLLGGKYESLVTLASSIELLHTATLVHDDLIDGSLLRRGIPTLNANWSPAATILTGDFLFAAASDLASRTESIDVMRLFSHTLMTIVNGEVNQLFIHGCSTDFDKYYHRIYAKTASLFETSAEAAAMISKADQTQIEQLKNFGCELGMAFQIVDDLLDYTGDENTVGKPVGGDLRQGLVTLPLIYYMRMNPADPTVQKLATGENLEDESEIKCLLSAVNISAAIEKTRHDAIDFIARAEKHMLIFKNCPERDALISMARYVVERNL